MRSLLFVPADNTRKLAKALASAADALIIDLEDSVAASARETARANAAAFLADARTVTPCPRLVVRINPLAGEDWTLDLSAVLSARPAALMLPKAAGGGDVARLGAALDAREADAGIARGATGIIAIATEVPIALLDMKSFVGVSSRLTGLAWGAEDLSAVLGASSSRDALGAYTSPFRLARDLTLITAAAAGIDAFDEIEADVRDFKRLADAAGAAARDGFTGKLAIHPDQIPIINAAFTPTPEAIADARAIVALFTAAPHAGVLTHGGRMIDRPHLVRAQRLIARAGLDRG